MDKKTVQDFKLKRVDIDFLEPNSVSTVRKFQAKSWEADGGSPSHFSSSHPLIFFLPQNLLPLARKKRMRSGGEVLRESLSWRTFHLNFSCLLRAPLFFGFWAEMIGPTKRNRNIFFARKLGKSSPPPHLRLHHIIHTSIWPPLFPIQKFLFAAQLLRETSPSLGAHFLPFHAYWCRGLNEPSGEQAQKFVNFKFHSDSEMQVPSRRRRPGSTSWSRCKVGLVRRTRSWPLIWSKNWPLTICRTNLR